LRNFARLASFSFALILGAPVAASAGDLQMQAALSIDWSTFAVASQGLAGEPGPVVSWQSQSSTVDGSAQDPVTVDDWTTSLSSSTATPSSSANSRAEPDALYAGASDSDPSLDVSPSALVTRAGTFTTSGAGTVTMSVQYSYQLAAPSSLGAPYGGFATAGVGMDARKIVDPRSGDTGGSSGYLNFSLDEPTVGGFYSDTGVLSITFDTAEPATFSFDCYALAGANLTAVSSVPEPSAPVLAWAGLGMLWLLKRRRRGRVMCAGGIE
jgi:uncharacterized protein (TIGR03382 family)